MQECRAEILSARGQPLQAPRGLLKCVCKPGRHTCRIRCVVVFPALSQLAEVDEEALALRLAW